MDVLPLPYDVDNWKNITNSQNRVRKKIRRVAQGSVE
jgi:hypothetical protein